MSQGNTSRGKMSPNHSYLFQLYFCAVPLPSALEHFVFECEDEFLCNNSQLLSIIIYYIYLFWQYTLFDRNYVTWSKHSVWEKLCHLKGWKKFVCTCVLFRRAKSALYLYLAQSFVWKMFFVHIYSCNRHVKKKKQQCRIYVVRELTSVRKWSTA